MVHVVKPLRADAARNRAAILDAARVEFGEHGPLAQIDRVAERAGVGVGTIYRHFPTKQALLAELVYERFSDFCDMADEAVAAEGTAFERFCALLNANAAGLASDAGTRFAILDGGTGVWARAGGVRDDLLEAVRPLVAEAKEDGDMRADFRVEEIGVLMCGVCAVMNYKPDMWPRHLEIVLDGLRAAPSDREA